jgi:hypothetical protein
MFRQMFNCCRSLVSQLTSRRELALQPIRVLPAIGLMLFASASAQGQSSMADGPPGGSNYAPVERPYNVDYGTIRHHASTAQEGILNGMSSYIQAIGVARVHHAQAAILEEQAEWAAYENVTKRIDTFNERRRMHRDRVAEDREYARLRDEEGKELLEHRRATEYKTAYRLSFEELNPNTGRINWPAVLQADVFEAQRDRLNELFAHRAEFKLESDHYVVREIESVERDLVASLRSFREQIPHAEYVAAQAFLRGLVYEAKYS